MAEDDDKLVEQCKKGDRSAFNELIVRYQQRVFNYAYHFIGDIPAAEDIT